MLVRVVILFLVFFLNCYSGINVNKSTSKIKVTSGATLTVENNINNFAGELVLEDGGSVEGGNVNFDEGVLNSGGTKSKIVGDLSLDESQIVLDGQKTFKGKAGAILESLKIKGSNNRLEGFLNVSKNIQLEDKSSTVTCALSGRIPCNLILNGGELFLEEDLYFVDDMFITGSGLVKLNRRKLKLGSQDITCGSQLYLDDAKDIELNANFHLAETWTFSGESVLQGNGKILYLDDGGEIVIEQGSGLMLQDVTIRNVNGNNIRCLDSNSTLSLQDASIILNSDYSFTTGSIEVIREFRIKGVDKFIYQSTSQSKIYSYCKMVFESGITFSFDPIYDSSISDWDQVKLCWDFEDLTSVLELKGATFHVTSTGISLLRGKMVVKEDSSLVSEATTSSDGLILGDGISADNDFDIEVTAGSRLRMSSGYIVDRSVA